MAKDKTSLGSILPRLPVNRGLAFGVIIITALFAFEVFNYSTTEFALSDLLGELSFAGLRWATILSIAFCGIDFAGIARLFTPEDNANRHNETWYLFGAWLLAATMNAMLTWWGVSLALLNHESLGNAVIERATLLRVVPIFVAILVWIIRTLIIGTFSVAGDSLFNVTEVNPTRAMRYQPRTNLTRAFSTPMESANLPRAAAPNANSANIRTIRASGNQTESDELMETTVEPVYQSLFDSKPSHPAKNSAKIGDRFPTVQSGRVRKF
jgi:hypothetical protein